MARVFISYSRESEAIVRRLVEDIDALGHDAWFDQELTGGQSWWDQILERIRDTEVLIVALSPEAMRSEACKREYSYAAALRKPLLPVVVADGVSTNLLPSVLSLIQFVDYRGDDRAAGLKLARAIREVPPPGPIPDPPPAAPEVPVSYLGSLRERIETPATLSFAEQSALVLEVKTALRDADTAADGRALVGLFRQRRDLLASIADELDAAVTGASSGTRSPGRPTPPPAPPTPPTTASRPHLQLDLSRVESNSSSASWTGEVPAGMGDVARQIVTTMQRLGHTIGRSESHVIEAKVGANLLTWGHHLRVELAPAPNGGTRLSVSSRSGGVQFIDYGRNRRVVESFLRELSV